MLILSAIKLVPDVGFELTTYRLQGGCSTTELIRRKTMVEDSRFELLTHACKAHVFPISTNPPKLILAGPERIELPLAGS